MTSPQAPQTPKGLVLVLGTVFVAFVVACYVVLIATGHDTAGVTTLLTVTLPAAGLSLVGIYQTLKNRESLVKVGEKVETVVSATNGPLTAMGANIRDIHAATTPDQRPAAATSSPDGGTA